MKQLLPHLIRSEPEQLFYNVATGQDKIHYIGHSMGTTTFLVLLNERPEYSQNIIMGHLLAPVAYVENMISPIRYLWPFTEAVEVS